MLRRTLLAATAAAAALAAAGVYMAQRHEISVVNLGVGKKILFISDLHIHTAREIPQLEYDLALIGGDTYDEWTKDLTQVAETLKQLKGPKIAVWGNHEHWASRKTPLRLGAKTLEEAGVHLLVDDWVYVGGLKIYGLDWREDPRDYPTPRDADVVLVHSPDAFHVAKTGVYLAGHTHGGQICAPWGAAVFTNSHFGYVYGKYRRGDAVMYVTRGLGEMLPRVFCKREIALIL